MARNMQAKLPATDTLYVHDIDASASKRFIEEVAGGKGAAVKVAECVREATEPSVSLQPSLVPNYNSFVMSLFQFNDLSWRCPLWAISLVILFYTTKPIL